MTHVKWTAAIVLLLLVGCKSDDGMHARSTTTVNDRPTALAATAPLSEDVEADDDEDGDEEEHEIALADVPANVMDAATAAVSGIVFEEANWENENGTVVYTLEGEADGTDYEVEVNAAGEVLEVESAQDDGEDDDD